MSLNPFSKKKPEVYDIEQEEQYEEDRKSLERIERDEQKFAKEQKKADEIIQHAEEARRKQEARRLEIDEQRLRHEEEEAKRRAKKETEALSKNPPPKVNEPAVPNQIAEDQDVREVDPRTPSRPPVAVSPVTESLVPVQEATENVVSPVIGSSPSIFFRTPWSKTEKPLHGLSMNGYSGDVHCDAGTFGKIASIGATLRGLKHQVPDRTSGAAGQNEDWFSTICAVSADGTKYVVSVVCDGLSSAPYSWYGARRTSTLLGRDVAVGIALLKVVNSQTLQGIVDNSLAEQASTLMTWNALEYGAPQVAPSQVDPVALGCTVTLTVVCADPSEDGSHAFVAGNVGDSPVFNLSKGAWRKVSPPDIDSGDILDTKTHAFPRHTECALVDDVLAQGECVLMTSDGVGNFILRNGMTLALGGYLSTRWNAPIGVLTFLNQLNFDLTTADDDRTAVAFWPA